MLQEFFNKKEPFAIVMHYEWLSTQPNEKNKIYEILFIRNKVVETKKLSLNEIVFFKKNKSKFDLIVNDNNGCAWEYLNFKNYKKQNKSYLYPSMGY